MSIYINRILNMRHIKAIGFDMDYTLVRYNPKAFEQLTYNEIQRKMVDQKKYPKSVMELKFNFNKAIRGLVIDRKNGNLLKLNLHGKIKQAYHGSRELDYKEMNVLYRGLIIDLNDANYSCIDTTFSISYAVIYSQIVELKDKAKNPEKFPSYEKIEEDVLDALDISHRDGSLKSVIKENVKKYIVKDPDTVKTLLRFKQYGKKLWVITNSDFQYTQLLLDYTINPYLPKGMNWTDLFEITVTSAQKPKFFTERSPFLAVDLATGTLTESQGPFDKGIFQGGCANAIQEDTKLSGDEILYLGDHIYGDILKLKKACNWRTALIVDELRDEVAALKKSEKLMQNIEKLMKEKTDIESQIDKFYIKELDSGKKVDKTKLQKHFDKIEKIDKGLVTNLKSYQKNFNAKWGEVMRAGQDASYFASQVDKYACIYMSKVSDLVEYSPRSYFRPKKRLLAHELD